MNCTFIFIIGLYSITYTLAAHKPVRYTHLYGSYFSSLLYSFIQKIFVAPC